MMMMTTLADILLLCRRRLRTEPRDVVPRDIVPVVVVVAAATGGEDCHRS